MIRKMTDADLIEVAELEARIFSDPWSLKVYEETLKLDEVIYLLEEINGRIVSVCGVRNIAGDGEITNVMTAQDYRGQGIAYRLLSQLLDEGSKIGINDFTLEVRAGNVAAINLYEKLGFISEGVRPGFYEHPKEDAVIMWKRALKKERL